MRKALPLALKGLGPDELLSDRTMSTAAPALEVIANAASMIARIPDPTDLWPRMVSPFRSDALTRDEPRNPTVTHDQFNRAAGAEQSEAKRIPNACHVTVP